MPNRTCQSHPCCISRTETCTLLPHYAIFLVIRAPSIALNSTLDQRIVDQAQPHKNTGSSRSSMKMAAGRRGWKSRQPLSQASTPSHWLARALHRWQAREDAIVSRYWLLGAWWLFDFYSNELGRLDWLPDRCKQRSRHHLLRQQPFFGSLSRTFRSQTSVRCRGPRSLLPPPFHNLSLN